MLTDHWLNLIAAAVRGGVRPEIEDTAMAFAQFALDWPDRRPDTAIEHPSQLLTPRPEEVGLFAYARKLMQGPSADAQLPVEQPLPPGRLAARDGNAVIRAVWQAVARQAGAGTITRPAAIESVLQSFDGRTFLSFHSDDHPESWWYDELVLLHAVTSYSILAGDPQAREVALKSAAYCHAEIQPDHATAQPWGLHAFVLNPDTHPFAEWLLNACQIQYAGEPRGAALVLLADALYCLKHVRNPRSAE